MDWSLKLRRCSYGVVCSGIVLCLLFPGLANAQKIWRLTQFEVARSNQETPPVKRHYQLIMLPDSWQHIHQNSRNAWYKTVFKIPTNISNLALYVPRHSMNIEVFIDGLSIGNGGKSTEPISRNHGRPMIFYLPEVLVKNKPQIELTIKITDNPWALGYLGSVYIGDATLLTNQYRTREFQQVIVPTGLGLVMILFAISSLYIFTKRPSETQYLWFALAMALFSVDTFNVYVTNIPFNRVRWEIYVQVIVFLFASSFIIFIHRFTKTGWDQIEPVFGILLILQIVVLSLADENYFYSIKNTFNIFIMLYGFILAVPITRKYRQTSSAEAGITLLAGIILLVLSVHTCLIHSGIISPENLHIIHYAAPGIFILISFSLLTKFLSSLKKSEELAKTLDQRVRNKEMELLASYEQVKNLEQRQAIADERVRIMRDMHDGFGGQLVGAIAMTDSNQSSMGELSKQLRGALTDLRIMVDSLDPNTQELPVALGMLRTRIQPVLDSSNITLVWDMDELPDTLELPPCMTLSMLRVLQESMTNIVKHSIASIIKIEIKLVDQISNKVLKICIWEDGKGFDPAATTGKGLRNIKQRIDKMEGNILHQNINNGFEICFTLPVFSSVQFDCIPV